MIKEWNCIPREKIPWNPTGDEAKGTGCRKCLEFSSHKVYDFDETAKNLTKGDRP